jgi:hypothetical protein
MRTRSVLAAAAAASFLVGATTPASAAEADCSIVDLSPASITMGLRHTKAVTFDVGTDCEEDAYIGWWLTFRLPDQTSPWGNPLLSNHPQESSSRYTYIENGEHVWERGDNAEAGARKVGISAFVGDIEDENFLGGTVDFQVLRRTTFGASFNASPEPRRKGQTIKIKGSLSQADWDNDTYQRFGAWVMLQFKAAGTDEYEDVKWVWNNGVDAKTTVIATRTGSWRYQYRGSDTTGASNSKGDTVIVKPARRR